MDLLIKLFSEFFQLGIFSYGGGLVIMALLQDKTQQLGWLTATQFADIVSIAQSTPGPIAINLATFIGYIQRGIPGSVIATLGVSLPGFVISLITAKFMGHVDDKPLVKAMMRGLRAFVIGMIVVAIYNIGKVTLFDTQAYAVTNSLGDLIDIRVMALFLFITAMSLRYDKNPFVYIIPSAMLGMILWH